MICGYRASADLVQVTECMGDANVLDALGISYEKALVDKAAIDGKAPVAGPPGSAK